jgi:hypothetical protein
VIDERAELYNADNRGEDDHDNTADTSHL